MKNSKEMNEYLKKWRSDRPDYYKDYYQRNKVNKEELEKLKKELLDIKFENEFLRTIIKQYNPNFSVISIDENK